MFTPQDLERMPIELEKMFSTLELNIMMDIIRRLKLNANEITRSADWQINRLNELGHSKASVKKYLKGSLELSNREIDKIYKEAIKSGYAEDERLYKETGKRFVKFEDNDELQQMIRAIKEQTTEELYNITQSTGFITKNGFTPLTQYYQDTLDNSIMGILNGSFDYNTALKQAVNEMTKSGLRTIDYASGRSYRIDSAVRTALMTGVNQVASKISDNNAKELDTDYFEVSAHLTARPTHQVWQGRVYKREELESICGLGKVDGLCGANCRHSYWAFIPGISTRTYTDEELEEIQRSENEKKEYNGKSYTAYEATQEQRRLERLMKKERQDIKLLKEGGANEEDIITAQARYRITSDDYVKFSKAMKQPQQMERVYGDGLKGKFGNPQAYKIIEKRANLYYNGNIKEYLKYNADLRKHYNWAIEKGELTPLVDYDTYMSTDASIRKELIGLTTTNEIKIKSYSKHFVDRVCGSIEQKRNGVEISNIKNIIINSTQIKKMEKSYVIFDDSIQISVNSETGNLIQTNPRIRGKRK